MDTVTGTLEHGLTIGDDTLKDFEMRAMVTSDMFEAEKAAGIDTPLAFNGALMARQIIKLGDISGPLDFRDIGKLHPNDYAILRNKQLELERLGEN